MKTVDGTKQTNMRRYETLYQDQCCSLFKTVDARGVDVTHAKVGCFNGVFSTMVRWLDRTNVDRNDDGRGINRIREE